MNFHEGWGSAAGTAVGTKLGKYIDDADAALVRIAMDGIRRIDVTFASAAIVGTVQRNLGKTAICLVNLG